MCSLRAPSSGPAAVNRFLQCSSIPSASFPCPSCFAGHDLQAAGLGAGGGAYRRSRGAAARACDASRILAIGDRIAGARRRNRRCRRGARSAGRDRHRRGARHAAALEARVYLRDLQAVAPSLRSGGDLQHRACAEPRLATARAGDARSRRACRFRLADVARGGGALLLLVQPRRHRHAGRGRCDNVERVQPWGISCVVAVLLAVQAAPGRAAEDLSVEAERRGERVEVRARALITAPAAVVWEVLTDYEHLPRFIPGIAKSVVRLRDGGRLLVEQSGEARFLFFSFPIEVQLEVTERPPRSISSRAVAGNVRRMTGRYEIQPDADRGTVLLRYLGEIEPDFELPPLIGVAALRRTAAEQFTAMVAEIERRAAEAPK